jgi:hypothetical protein
MAYHCAPWPVKTHPRRTLGDERFGVSRLLFSRAFTRFGKVLAGIATLQGNTDLRAPKVYARLSRKTSSSLGLAPSKYCLRLNAICWQAGPSLALSIKILAVSLPDSISSVLFPFIPLFLIPLVYTPLVRPLTARDKAFGLCHSKIA